NPRTGPKRQRLPLHPVSLAVLEALRDDLDERGMTIMPRRKRRVTYSQSAAEACGRRSKRLTAATASPCGGANRVVTTFRLAPRVCYGEDVPNVRVSNVSLTRARKRQQVTRK